MRTYAAFSLLAIASGTAMAAPTSPDISRGDVGFSSLPNSPDLSNGGDMSAFQPMRQGGETEDSSSTDPLAGLLGGGDDAGEDDQMEDLSQEQQQPSLSARSSLPYREYEKWLEQQRQAKLAMMAPTKRDVGTSSDETEGGEEETAEEPPTSPGDTAPATAGSAKVPFTGEDNTLPTSRDSLPASGDNKVPNIPGVEKIAMIDGISGQDGVKIDTLDNATKGMSMSSLKKPAGPSRMRHRRRDLRSALEQLHLDASHSGESEMPSKAKQLTTLSRKVRRNPRPSDDIVLHSNGIIPELPKALQND